LCRCTSQIACSRCHRSLPSSFRHHPSAACSGRLQPTYKGFCSRLPASSWLLRGQGDRWKPRKCDKCKLKLPDWHWGSTDSTEEQ
jgi:hypothetical protein